MHKALGELKRGVICFLALWREVLFVAPYRPFEAVWSLLITFSAVTVLNPEKSLYGVSTTYKYLLWLPEGWFGAILLFVGLNSMLALTIHMFYQTPSTLAYRFVCSAGVALLFSLLFILLFAGNSGGMLIPWLGVFGIVGIITSLRMWDDLAKVKDIWRTPL